MAANSCKRVGSIRNEKGIAAPALVAVQRGSGSVIAIRFEGILSIFLHDRTGGLIKRISIPSNCIGLEWDADGDVLAILLDSPGSFLLWELHSQKLIEMESGLKDPGSVLAWSASSKILAYGTLKGNICVYNHHNLRKIPVVGNHTKKVCAMAWSGADVLAYGTHEDTLSLCSRDGDLLNVISLRGRPTDLNFGLIKVENESVSSNQHNAVSCVVGERILFIQRWEELGRGSGLSTPMELGFQAKYGELVSHHWHGDGYICVAFRGAYVVLLSSHAKEIGTELLLFNLRDDILRHAVLSPNKRTLAVCGGQSTLTLLQATDPRNVISITDVGEEDGRVRPLLSVAWSSDGALLVTTTQGGDVGLWVTSLPSLGAFNTANQLVVMSSLTDALLHTFSTHTSLLPTHTFSLHVEPSLLALGPNLLAAVVHNTASFYSTREGLSSSSSTSSSTPQFTITFNATVSALVLNVSHCAALCANKAFLRRLQETGDAAKDMRTFPDASAVGGTKASTSKVTAIAMAKDIFFYGTDTGKVFVFHVEHMRQVLSLDVSRSPIKGIYPDGVGGQFLIVDKVDGVWYGSVLGGEGGSPFLLPLEEVPSKVSLVLWDLDFSSRNTFLLYPPSSTKIWLYAALKDPQAPLRPRIVFSARHDILKTTDSRPLAFRGGVVFSFTKSGKVGKSPCLYEERPGETGESLLRRLTELGLFEHAIRLCYNSSPVGTPESETKWRILAHAAMNAVALPTAERAWFALKDFGMVAYVRSLLEDNGDNVKRLQGLAALGLKRYEEAEALFLQSDAPQLALEMHADLQDFQRAVVVSQVIGKPPPPSLTLSAAADAEAKGDYARALSLYERVGQQIAVTGEGNGDDGESSASSFLRMVRLGLSPETMGGEEMNGGGGGGVLLGGGVEDERRLRRGRVRCLLRLLRTEEGLRLLQQTGDEEDSAFLTECADIFMEEERYDIAGALYEKGGDISKAVAAFIKGKEEGRAMEAMAKNPSPSGWRLLAKMKEEAGKLEEAARCYGNGGDVDSAVRLYLALNLPEEAIYHATNYDSSSSVDKVAEYYVANGNKLVAIDLYVHARRLPEATQLAMKYGLCEAFIRSAYKTFVLGKRMSIPPEFKESLTNAVEHLRSVGDELGAGRGWALMGNYAEAVPLLMKVIQREGLPEEEEKSAWAFLKMSVVNSNDNAKMGEQFAQFVLGEWDGKVRDFKHLYEYYALTRRVKEAAKTSLIISEQALKNGEMGPAYTAVWEGVKLLRGEIIPTEMTDHLQLLHAFRLMTIHSHFRSYAASTQMALRLRTSLHLFAPQVQALILSTGAVHAHAAEQWSISRELAISVYKDKTLNPLIPDKHRPAIENIVRRRSHSKESGGGSEELQTPCPRCHVKTPVWSLTCPHCLSKMPMCIVSGKHVNPEDCTACLNCDFPINRSDLEELVKAGLKVCPMCKEPFDLPRMHKFNDPQRFLMERATSSASNNSSFVTPPSTKPISAMSFN